jgi:hypothetical protein
MGRSDRADHQHHSLIPALRQIMRPLVRLLVRNNLTLQVFTDILKDVYVSVAAETLEQEKQKPTESRISIMTGVHRKDVKSIRAKEEGTPTSSSSSRIAEMIARWQGVHSYADDAGLPLVLPYMPKSEGAACFTRLAADVSRDIHPRTMLDELVRLGYVSHDGVTDMVTL